ncbi:D-hexose-6-phosphate mutarotase [Pseudoalteromonas shioyasakiensis]|uniref:D-hexose-6-phosphate mutarotase n=1 Tax=Pseudoalteromonas shioyasakiensis TaxID=1190813 RepID=UPI0021173781|nr:D-hexose-6-phosphate mutarotase [Pseudoalteromonas shioyasakiensis]MCQ8879716.1 D-hexose-6-phosphate mutarotase [Pseudoalteromonas shioyasakiensis]
MKLSPSVSIEQSHSGLEYINVASDFCSAKIFLQGAQLTEFTPNGKKPLIWVSSEEDYQEGKSVRGGIPICWPWFGVNPNPDWPIHGVARTSLWRAGEVSEQDNEVRVSLTLPMTQVDETYWPHKSTLKVEFILTNKLEVRLTTTNLSEQTITFSQALHTYFPTPAIEDTTVDGLQGAKYIEFGEGPFEQDAQVGFARETDMVYTQAGETQRIITPDGIIEVSRENSNSCVLWNPWIDKSKRLSNFADDEYHTMLCLEAANVMDDSAVVEPGQSHTLATTISWV